ncbi:MAG: ricin-type beta-trefoil lectin domain protein, partial [Algicola sp.]|nr:ricin-type beta-trefoil lectin domain protein [Algicola sp.]
MRINLLKLLFTGSLLISSIANAIQTPPNDDGGGNTVYFDRHELNCGYQGFKSMRLFRPLTWQIAFDYQCQDIGETTTVNRYTPPNDDGAGNSIYLDRHVVDCANNAIQYLRLYRPSSTQISYHYKCGQKALTNVRDYYTPANDVGGGNAIFLDRHNISCPNEEVLSYFKLQRPSESTIQYHYKCGQPYTTIWQEVKVEGKCLDGSGAIAHDNVYMYDCHGGDNQRWFVDGDGLVHNKANEGLCIDVQTGFFNTYLNSIYAGVNARLESCDNTKAGQKFNFQQGRLALQYGGYLCLDMNPSTNNVYYYGCHNGTNQQFSFNSSVTLNNVDPFDYLNNIMNSNALSSLASAFQIGDFKVVALDLMGTTTITGKIRNMNNGNPMGMAVELAVGMRKYLLNDPRTDIPVTLTLTNLGNDNYQAKIRFEVVKGWREVNTNNPMGTEFILEDADIILTATVQNGTVTRKVGVEGTVFIKPTSFDNWLYTAPNVEREIGTDPTTDFGIVVKGACASRPNSSTNGTTACNGNWDIMNAGILSANSEANGEANGES